MKNKKIVGLIIFILILISIFFISKLYFIQKNGKINEMNSEKIEEDMSKNEVLKIMGKPEARIVSFFNETDSLYYYKPTYLASSGIYIQFDYSTQKVNFIRLSN